MSDWDDWTKKANDDDLFDYSIQSEKNIPKSPSGGGGGCGSGCLLVVIIIVVLIVLAAIIITIFA